MRLLFFIFGLGLFFTACEEVNPKAEKSLTEIKSEGPISSIIRNPITADGLEDTVNVAQITFEEDIYEFGEVKEGDIVSYAYKFTNTGKVPLIINDARSTCGCTVPKWPKAPILPGESGQIDVRFDTKNKKNEQKKYVTITANTYPSNTKVLLQGFVKAKK